MLEQIITQRRRSLGGFEVGRVLPFAGRRMVGPFVFLDHMGPVEFAPGIPREVDVLPHPHIGLATVTYLFAGEIMHRDSVGSEQEIRPGEVNWMTAGRGISHSERFERARREGGPLHGVQAWVGLPEADEEIEPAFAHYVAGMLPAFAEAGVEGRLIAGDILGLRSPVSTRSPLFYLHLELAPGGRFALPASHPERALYIVAGEIDLGGRTFVQGQMLVLTPGLPVMIRAYRAATVLALGGDPIGPRHIEWNFVSSSRERIEQAKADWRARRMKLPDLDSVEFVPLPPDPGKPGGPMS